MRFLNYLYESNIQASRNCIACIVRSKIFLFQFLYPLRIECQHSQINYSPFPVNFIATPAVYLNYGFWFLLLIPMASHLGLTVSLCSENELFCLILIEDQLFPITGLIFYILNLLISKKKIYEIDGWSKIVKNRMKYCLKDAFNAGTTARIEKNQGIVTLLSILGITCIVVSRICFSYDTFKFNYLRHALLLITALLQSNMVIEIYQKIQIVATFLLNLRKKLDDSLKLPVYVTNSRDLTLVEHLKRYKKLIMAINTNLSLVMRPLIIILVLWEMQTIFSLIINIFIIAEFRQQDEYFGNVFMLQIRTMSTLCAIVYLMFTAESLRKKVCRSYIHIV